MNVPANQDQDRSWQAAVIAITEARDQIGKNLAWASEHGSVPEGAVKEPTTGQLGHSDSNVAKANEHAPAREGTARESTPDRLPVARGPRRVALMIIGLVTVAGVYAAAFHWQSLHDQTAPDPVSTSSLPKALQSKPTSKDILTKAEVTPLQSQPLAQSPEQSAAPSGSVTAMLPTTAQSIESLSRQIAKLEHVIDQLNNHQIRLDRDSADFAERLKTMREQMARDYAAIADQHKAAQAQLALDHVNLVEQLKALQSQLARDNAVVSERLKASEEQMGKVAKTFEQSLRPRPLRQSTAKPVSTPRSPQTTAQPQVPIAQ